MKTPEHYHLPEQCPTCATWDEMVKALKKHRPCGMVNGCHPSEGEHTDECRAVKALIAKAEGR